MTEVTLLGSTISVALNELELKRCTSTSATTSALMTLIVKSHCYAPFSFHPPPPPAGLGHISFLFTGLDQASFPWRAILGMACTLSSYTKPDGAHCACPEAGSGILWMHWTLPIQPTKQKVEPYCSRSTFWCSWPFLLIINNINLKLPYFTWNI